MNGTKTEFVIRVENDQGITIGDLRQLFDMAGDQSFPDSLFVRWSIGGEAESRKALRVEIAHRHS